MNTLKKIVGWLMLIWGCWIGIACGMLVIGALFGQLEFDSFGEGLFSAIAWLLMAILFWWIACVGYKMKKSVSNTKKQPAPVNEPVEIVKKTDVVKKEVSEKKEVPDKKAPESVTTESETKVQPLPNMPALLKDSNPFKDYQKEDRGLDSFDDLNQDIKAYYLLKEGYSVMEAVEQYLKNGKLNGIVHIRVAHMPTNVTERLQGKFLEDCKENQIRIVTHVGEYYVYDAVSRQEFAAEISTWPGSADDAATYGEWKFVAKKSKQNDGFLFCEKKWAGKAENGVDQIWLKTFEYDCVITYKSITRNCYATPPVEDVRTKERRHVFEAVANWSQEEFLAFINRRFHATFDKSNCCSEKDYLAWIEKNNTEYYPMKIMLDGKIEECMICRNFSMENRDYMEVKFQGQTYMWETLSRTGGLGGYDHALEICWNNRKYYYLYYTEVPNKNDTLYWIINQIDKSVFDLLKSGTYNREDIVLGEEIGRTPGMESSIRCRVYAVLALATGRTIGAYRDFDGTYQMRLEKNR